jgi:TetR/AcrR family transcriptional repressor of nem operon
MRYPGDRKEKTRARILTAAGKVFRRHGYDGAGVDKIMEEAGLTAGGFYAHFDSKNALLAEALERVGGELRGRREAASQGLSGGEYLDAFLTNYLSRAHRRQLDDGCPLAALVSDVARANNSVKQSFERMLRELAGDLASQASDALDLLSEERVLAALALCVGGLGLARSVRNEGLAQRILKACRTTAKEILGVATKSAGPAPAPRSRGVKRG